MTAVGCAAWILPGDNGGNPVLVLTAISSVAVVFATLWLIRPSYILAVPCIEGRTLACRLTHEGGVFPCKNVWVSFCKQNSADWEGWPFHAFREAKFSAGTISSKTERVYNLKPIHQSYNEERGFLLPIVCEGSWKTLFRRKTKEYVLRAEDAEGLFFERLKGIDYFVESNRGVLQKMTDRAATILRLIEEHGDDWNENWGDYEDFNNMINATRDEEWLKLEDKDHALHDQYYHKPGGRHFGECTEEAAEQKWREAQERRRRKRK